MTDSIASDPTVLALKKARDAAVNALVSYVEQHKHDYARWPLGTTVYRFDTGEVQGIVAEITVEWSPEDHPRVQTLVRAENGFIVGCYPPERESWDMVGTPDERREWLRKQLESLGSSRV